MPDTTRTLKPHPHPTSSTKLSESSIQQRILLYLSTRLDIRVWRNNSGVAMMKGRGGRMRTVKFGVTGQADLSGILAGGRRLEIEVKTEKGRQSREQIAFGRMITTMGGLYILARSVEDVINSLPKVSTCP